MNAPAPPPRPQVPPLSRPAGPEERRSAMRLLVDRLFGRVVTVALAVIALGLASATFVTLADAGPLGLRPGATVGLILANLVVLLLLSVSLVARLARVWADRRRGYAGSRLHVRLVLLFAGVAATPAIAVAGFAVAFFNYGIDTWFNDRVRTALDESLQASRAYLDEHRGNIRSDALAMANDLNRAALLLPNNGIAFAQVLATQTAIRGLSEAQVFSPDTAQVIAHAGVFSSFVLDTLPEWALAQARRDEVAVIGGEGEGDIGRVRAVISLGFGPGLMLVIGRPVDSQVLGHMLRTEESVAAYAQQDRARGTLQVTFALIFALVALLVLFAAALVGLFMANQIARPIGWLITAAERVRGGDLSVRVAEADREDEIAGLSRAFNRMTGQLSAQRAELMDAYRQIDERRRFTETVLSGVSAGVIGLDAQGRVELPNRAAGDLLSQDLLGAIGLPLDQVVPEFAPLLAQALAGPDRPRTAEVQIARGDRRRTVLLRIGAEVASGRPDGFVATFDDITALQSAQRQAAWADVARRIAHEIKNPLTPIQLSAERLKRRFLKEITSDKETFAQCADTIVRHVGDIGRMVDEFSAFARMPQPVMKPEDLSRIVRDALVLPRQAREGIDWRTDLPERGPVLPCDRRQIGQALTNLLQNAADAVAMAQQADRPDAGSIAVKLTTDAEEARIAVIDDGIGLPRQDRERLTEPYVTHKPKGTGLGLAIVKKIMEDHGGGLALADRMDGPGAIATLTLPLHGLPRAA